MKVLVNRILNGDPQAVIKFYNLYSPKISKYLNVKLSPEDAQEILNDVFFEAVDSLSLLRSNDNILSWLYKIAHNKTVDFYRKRKIKSVLLSQVPFLKIIESEINDPEFQFEKNKLRDSLEEAFYAISNRYRQILKLHYEEKKSVKELAPIFDLSIKATESLLYRARQSFKTAYGSSATSGHRL